MATARQITLIELTEDDGSLKLCSLDGQIIVTFNKKEDENLIKKP